MLRGDQPNEAISCTRTVLLIAILSGLGLSLLQPLETHVALRDLGNYIALRHALAAQLNDLDHNPCFGSSEINKMSLDTLSQSDCLKNRKPGSNAAQEAIGALRVLTDIGLTEKARRVNYHANFSIHSWKVRSNTLFEFHRSIGMLSFGTAKELSAYEYPEMSNYAALFSNYQVLHTQWTPLTVRLVNAGTFVALGMLLAMAYFWLFFLEAIRSGNSNKEGTIFTAVRRTQFSRFLFFAFMSIPPIVIGLLLMMSWRLSEGLEELNKSHPFLDTVLFVAVVMMSALIMEDRPRRMETNHPPTISRF